MFRHKFLSMVIVVGILASQSVPHAMAATLCDSAQFISDLTVPDGTSFAPGAAFTKTWRLANNGTCTWSTSYKLTWVGGDSMGATSVTVPVSVPPAQMVDVSINLTAPATAGHYKSLWKLSNASGGQFGIGSSGTDAFWVDINVVDTRAVIYDFVSNAPYAQWKSGAGVLPFPGTSGDYRGFSYQVNNPHLEDDSYDSQPGLLVVPQNKYNGYIQAMYPEFQVQAGDKLQTLVNCEFGATSCYVTFRIDYLLPSGLQKTLWTWKEAPDRRFYRASLDLSSLAGQKVRFVFMLLSSGFASGDRAVWGSPRIVRTGTVQPPAPPATLTPLPPLTPTATPITPPPPTMQPAGCDRASFVTDVTVPDGTQFAPGEAFTKTWRLKNAGSCIWTTSYKLIYYSGDQMSAPTTVNLPWGATFGQTVDISVNMIAPSAAGNYRGFWILANASGQFFGLGTDASKPVWVDIKVVGESTNENGYQFWMNACSAEWKSGAGPLPCPGTEGDTKGFITPLQYSHLEDGTMGPAPSLLMAPENKYNGYIQGTFPAFTVQPGDHFFTVTGCEYGYSCYVTFRLDYMTPNGGIFNFWQWREQNDKQNHMASVDLSPLAGRSVRFILTILATGSATNDRVRWGGPSIVRVSQTPPATATYTPVPPTVTPITPTVTPSLGPPVVPLTMRSLYMLDAQNGWALSDLNVLRTFDGGSTWYNVLDENLPAGGYFASPNKAWVISNYADLSVGSLYRTSNGGVNWTKFDVPFNNGIIQFLDDNTGFVLYGEGSGMQKQAVALYQTTDGGATWTLKYDNAPTSPNPGTSLPFSGHKNGMTFRDANTGWVGGDYPASGYVYLYKTTDGGTTWSQVSLPLPAGYQSAYITTTAPKFFGLNEAILPVWMTVGTGMRDLFLYVSHDGGTTWTASPAFARNAELTEIVTTGFAISWNWQNYFHVTNNTGGTWTTVTPNITFGDGFRELDFVYPTTGWARVQLPDGHAALYRTTDGGSTWTQLFGHVNPTPTPDPAAFAQTIVNTLNARNFNELPALMDATFGFAYWESQGTSYPSDQAIESLRQGLTVTLIPDATQDLTSLLGGMNPYSIMGLDPAKSYALYVSGWGSDNNAEAILYVTQRADGSLYWHSALIAPWRFIHVPTPSSTPVTLIGPYAVIGVASNDVLNIRSGAGTNNPVVGSFPFDSISVMRTGPSGSVDNAMWVEVQNPNGGTGWVNSFYLNEYVTHEAFCADTRVNMLIEQLKGSMNQSNGDMFAALVSPVHGLNINRWAYEPPVHFTVDVTRTAFTSTTVYEWGFGPRGGPDPETGTFAQAIQPKLQEVFNAPNMETYCDELTKVFPLATPWPYTNIRYYNVYKPASGQTFDFRTWLIGIEYINGQPYLHSMVTVQWEP